MLRTTLRGFRARRRRLFATALSVMLAVGFITGTLIFGDTAKVAIVASITGTDTKVDAVVRTTGPKMPPAVLEKVRRTPGVEAADGRMSMAIDLLTKKGRRLESLVDVMPAGTVEALSAFQVSRGRKPSAAGEAAINDIGASRGQYAIGDTITLLDYTSGRHTFTLVGLVTPSAMSSGGGPVVVVPDAQFSALPGSVNFRAIVVKAAGGAGATDLVGRLKATVGPGFSVLTADQWREPEIREALRQAKDFLLGVQLFAWIALLVSAFVIYNTFNIIVAQRLRESGLLRCVGAGRRQLFSAVLLEAAVVGLIGAALGIAAGVGVAYAMFTGAAAIGADFPSHPPVITVVPVVVALTVGLFVTSVSAFIPAIRATRVAPMAALQTASAAGANTVRRRALLIAVAFVLGGLGVSLTMYGVGQRLKDTSGALMAVVGGGAVCFLGVLVVSPLFIGPVTRAVGWLPTRVFGGPVRLAVANARRNPGRAAATAAALMIGVGLLSGSAVLIATAKAFALAEIRGYVPADYVLSAKDEVDAPAEGSAPAEPPALQPNRVPSAVVDKLRADSAFAAVAVMYRSGLADGDVLTALEPQGRDAPDFPVISGSMNAVRPGTVALQRDYAKQAGKKLGDQFTTKTADGQSRILTVGAIFLASALYGDVMVDWADFASLASQSPDKADTMVLIRAAANASPALSDERLDAALTDLRTVAVRSFFTEQETGTKFIDTLTNMIAALLGLAILIAFIGIMNTISLSMVERTRESAVGRALGLTRAQLYATVTAEAVLLAVVGAIVGGAFGVTYALITVRVLITDATVYSVPVLELGAGIAVAALAGALAAALPARRAARASIVSALAEA
jgi:putative ABC transport system permease protein